MTAHPSNFVNPLGRNPFLPHRDTNGFPKLTEAELEAGLRAYCRLWGIPVKGKARCKPIPAPKGSVPRGIADSYLAGQLNWTRPEEVAG